MKHFLIFALIIASFNCASAQPTIEIYLTNHPNTTQGSAIESIEETYELMIKEVPPRAFKITTMFDNMGKILSETKYSKAGGKQGETKYEYNQNHKLTKKTHRYFVNMLGWKTDETLLNYNDTTGFISEIRIFKNGALQSMSKVFCDSLGNPRETRVLDDKGGFSMVEKISFSPSANLIRVMMLRPTGQLVSRWLYPIDSTKPYQTGQIERQFYSNGAVMLESLEDQTKTDQGYYYEYNYDSQGNWIEKDTYQVTLGKKNKIKDKKLEHKILRTIKYF
jgi:hypothetical protein